MKNKRMLLVGMILAMVVGILICAGMMFPTGVYATEDVNDYNAQNYPLPSPIFPHELPNCAEVVSFSYYNYWHEVNDHYIEFKFSSREEMEKYLNQWRTKAMESLKKDGRPTDREWLITDQNPYSSSYTDVFCTTYITYAANREYTGYSIEPTVDGNRPTYHCNFGATSYSYDELTVIHTYVYGYFREAIHHRVPRFFQRFDLPLDENHERRFYFD